MSRNKKDYYEWRRFVIYKRQRWRLCTDVTSILKKITSDNMGDLTNFDMEDIPSVSCS